MRLIYLDHNASTPPDPEVADAMRVHLNEAYGNPSSPHWTRDPVQVGKVCGASAPVYPDGLYLRFNDMSLPKGGRFDIDGNWSGSHSSHRKGTGMDINRNAGVWDPTAGAGLPVGFAGDCFYDLIREACGASNGHFVIEVPIHCELD